MGVSIKVEHPELIDEFNICSQDLNRFRYVYVQNLITEEKGKIETIEKEVVNSHDSELLAVNPAKTYAEETFLGDNIAGGSWSFIITSFSILLVWILVYPIVLLQFKHR